MQRSHVISLIAIALLMSPATFAQVAPSPDQVVGTEKPGRTIVPNAQTIEPAGQTIAYAGRPLDLCLSPNGKLVYVKNTTSLTIIEAASWKVRDVLPLVDDSGSMHGIIAVRGERPDSTRIYLSGSHKSILEAETSADGVTRWARRFTVPAGPGGKNAHSLGMAISPDRKTLLACLSRNNTLAVIDLKSGEVTMEIPVGICPWSVLIAPAGDVAYVSNFGGRRPEAGARTAETAGSAVEVDTRTIPISGTISKIDLASHKVIREINVGLHPAQTIADRKFKYLYVANANSDSVSVIETSSDKVIDTIAVRPDANLPFGSVTNALSLSADESTLFCANGGNNAIAVVNLTDKPGARRASGFIPTGWFPGAIVCQDTSLFIVNVKGEGSREIDKTKEQRNSHAARGSVTKVAIPAPAELSAYTSRALANARVPETLRAMEASNHEVPPVPVPAHPGEPSVIKHVVYVLKENRTYDQLFGDIGRGNSEPKLCTFGREITPNHHAIADEFVLLDNYYCNGILSADGHQWATQGMVTDYQEKDFGGWTRSYDFGTDALTYASCDFLWDTVLLHGLSFRNYGEFDFPRLPKSVTWFDVQRDWPAGKIKLPQSIQVETLRKYSCPTYPGWILTVPDVYRMEAFLKELAEFEKKGEWPSLIIVYLPQDHTSGTGESVPTPRAFVADNDLALGQMVSAISRSKFWASTCIFVNEDDPQDGYDHVDGHRSICLVASPYAKRGAVVSHFYNQTSVMHTMLRMLGLPPTNQMVAGAPTMEDCFTTTPNFQPYTLLQNRIALDERNGQKEAMTPQQQKLADVVNAGDFSRPDRIEDDAFNQLLWLASGRTDAYPTAFSGAHGKGLKALGLKLDKSVKRDDVDN